MRQIPRYTLIGINYWPETTGNAPYNRDLAEALANRGSITVITGIPHYPQWRKLKNHSDEPYLLANPNIKLVRVNHPVPSKPSNFLRAWMEVSFGLRAVLSGRVQGTTVVLVSPAMLSSAIALAWIRLVKPRTKVLLWVQDLYEQGLRETGSRPGLLSRLIVATENWLLAHADLVVFAHEGFISAKKLENSPSMKSLRNWSQFVFTPSKETAKTRAKYGLGEERIVLHIGNMGLKQGLEYVIDTAEIAQNHKSKSKFVFVGGGNQSTILKQRAANLSNVLFIDPVSDDELSKLLSMADLLLVHERPGVKEMSIPSKLTTYFQTGIPVLVCSEPGSLAARLISENGLGTWVKSGDPSALLAIIDNIELSKAANLAKKAKEFAQTDMSKQAALDKFIKLIDSKVGGN